MFKWLVAGQNINYNEGKKELIAGKQLAPKKICKVIT
jgi:hypothetical protein